MNIQLTIEEATELHNALLYLTVSYYNSDLRSALSKVIYHCAQMIKENEEILLDIDMQENV